MKYTKVTMVKRQAKLSLSSWRKNSALKHRRSINGSGIKESNLRNMLSLLVNFPEYRLKLKVTKFQNTTTRTKLTHKLRAEMELARDSHYHNSKKHSKLTKMPQSGTMK